MNRRLLFLALIIFQFGFSQTERPLNGTVLNNAYPVQGVDVINLSTKNSTASDRRGLFTILVKQGDTLLFYSAKYEHRNVIVAQADLDSKGFAISLTPKGIELDEVVIEQGPLIKVKFDQVKLDQRVLERAQENPKHPHIYDGSIVNGVDFVRLGKDVIKLYKNLFKDDEERPIPSPDIDFKDYVKMNVEPDYFVNTLQLAPDELELFLEFCAAAPDWKTKISGINVLRMMDLLLAKSIEFKRLPSGN